jgi:hypothetical protein
VLWEITQGIYGMPQAGRLFHLDLVKHLLAAGYRQCPMTPCLFTHPTRSTKFVVYVDDFFAIYDREVPDDAAHLIDTIRRKYLFKVDMAGRQFLGFTVNHEPSRHRVTISMPGYVAKAIKRLGYQPGRPVRSPLLYTPPVYGSAAALMERNDSSTPLSDTDAKFIQRAVGSFLYYANNLDSSLFTAVTKVAMQQKAPTADTLTATHRFLDYVAAHPDASIVFHASNMQLYVHSDASYNSEPGSRSRAGGYFSLGNPSFQGSDLPPKASSVNGAIAVISKVIPTVCSNVAEAEYAAMFINGQLAESIRQSLEDLGFHQEPTTIIYDNEISGKIATKTCKIKRSKTIAMRYHWVRDRVEMGHFQLNWQPGKLNLADFFTKAHPIHHHVTMSRFFVKYPKLEN